MDRSEMLKGAAAVAAGGVVPAGWAVQDGETFFADFSRDSPDGTHPAIPAKPYDPIAVLEAMRERLKFSIEPDFMSEHNVVVAWWKVTRIGDKDKTSIWRPNFTSAVQWLHRQAAAADAEFAKAFPVPE